MILSISEIAVLFSLAVFFFLVCLFLNRIWRLLSVFFVRGELNEAKEARELLRLMNKQNILEFLGKEPDPAMVQSFLQLIYAFNRIGGGIRKGYLSQSAIFVIWQPYWFIQKWTDLKPLIEQERNGREDEKLYEAFEWLATKRCPRIIVL